MIIPFPPTRGRAALSDRDRHNGRDRRGHKRGCCQQAERIRLMIREAAGHTALAVSRPPVAPREQGNRRHRDRGRDAKRVEVGREARARDQRAARCHVQRRPRPRKPCAVAR